VDAERYRQIKTLLLDALDLPAAERLAFLARTCGADHALRQEVEALLVHDDQEEGVLAPIGPLAARHTPSAQEEPTKADALVGREIGNYRLLRLLGHGGMGVVYLAEDVRLGRRAALKFLRSDLVFDQQALARFMREARAGAALDHPNICTLYGVEHTPAGEVFLAMAYCRGETLKMRLSRGALPAAEACRVARQIGAALSAAHEAGVIHRDVKPANIMLAGDAATLLDFGIAKLVDQTSLTARGVTMGTPAYASPEQLLGGSVDHRADVWALGVVLYEMLTGRRPFERTPAGSALGGDTWLPVHDLNSGIEARLNSVIAAALDPDPSGRWQSMPDFLAALEETGAGPPERDGMTRMSVEAAETRLAEAEALAIAGRISEAASMACTVTATPGASLDTIVRAARLCHFASDWSGAVRLLHQAAERAVASPVVWLDLALTYAAWKRTADAEDGLSRALTRPFGQALVVAAIGNSSRASSHRIRAEGARRQLDRLEAADTDVSRARLLLEMQFGDTGRPLEYLYGGSRDGGVGRFVGLLHVPGSLGSLVREVGLVAYLGLEAAYGCVIEMPAALRLLKVLDALGAQASQGLEPPRI
jgi:hypothetical protein